SEDEQITPTKIISRLQNAQTETRPAWKPMHLQPVFRHAQCFAYEDGVYEDERIFYTAVCLPSGDGMTEAQQDEVIAEIKDCFSGNGD
ncbi:MAG: pyridoxal phosphate-dependent aminotransferase, partial [Clostridiales bacterium]|nr:pyridoxal phosphate-dependent aminotransferase [Clostridiales bacterium]